MIDLGFIALPMETLNWLAIGVAVSLAIIYIGGEILSTLCGIVAVVIGLRILLFDAEIVLWGHQFGTFEASASIIIGLYAIYMATQRFGERIG